MVSNEEYIKILVAGEGGVGKTTLTRSFIEDQFVANFGLTIGITHFTKDITINDSEYTLQIWDFGGQIRFRPLLPDFISGTAGILFLFDLSRIETLFENISKWISVFRSDNPDIPILLLGSKCDLKYKIDDDTVNFFKDQFQFFDYIKVSSLKMLNVNSSFQILAEKIIKNKNKS
ncbi:MAG: GTP-binding protein [Promethearchaeota archaeon]